MNYKRPVLLLAGSLMVSTFGIVVPAATDHRGRVEGGLLPAVVIKGQAAVPMRLADRMAYYGVPGVSIAVINDEKIEWTKGYGVLDAGGSTAVTPRTRFQAASISKPVTAMAALALVQQRRLNLDEDVNLKLRSWRVPDNEFTRKEKVTLRRLLNHSAGTTGMDVGSYVAGQAMPTLLQALDGAAPAVTPPIRVDVVPGSTWRYSGGGYSVAQLLVTEVTGKRFPELAKDLVLSKIGMNDSYFHQPLPKEWEATSATGHDATGKPIEGRRRTFPEMAAAGLWTTAPDLARFAIEVQRSFRGKSKVLSAEMTKQMLTKYVGDYGLGVWLGGKERVTSFGHPGSNEGFTCMLTAYLDRSQGAVVMTNGDRGDSLFGEILRAIAHEYGWPDYQPIEKMTIEINPAVYESYVGQYEFSGIPIAIRTQEGQLQVLSPPLGANPLTLYPGGEDQFFVLERDLDVTFVRGAGRDVIELRVRALGDTVTAKRVK
jgi:CubicO group peptidase (beta-lactamase class C family)